MVLQTELASRQLGLLLEQWGGAWTLLLEDEWRVGERLRNEAVAAAERSATAEPGRPT